MWGWWFETPSRSLWHQCDAAIGPYIWWTDTDSCGSLCRQGTSNYLVQHWITLRETTPGHSTPPDIKHSYTVQRHLWVLTLRALKFSPVKEIHIYSCRGQIFCVGFQRYPLKLHTKYFTRTVNDIPKLYSNKRLYLHLVNDKLSSFNTNSKFI